MAMRHDQAAICLRVNKLWVEVLQAAFRKANNKNTCAGVAARRSATPKGGGSTGLKRAAQGIYGARASESICSSELLKGATA